MKILINVQSMALDTPYGGQQELQVAVGEYRLEEIFRLPFFRIIIDDIIDGEVCFRLMEGAVAHYFVLSFIGDSAEFERQTSIGYDSFTFTLID
jgi:hypothetical protein